MNNQVCLTFGACLLFILAGCDTFAPSADVLSAPTRALTTAEQGALGHQIALTLKDPGSAQFQWPPVVLTTRGGTTDYCGFVNAKNSMGGYAGFSEFYAQLTADSSGAFTSAAVKSMGEQVDDISTGITTNACKKAGYGSIALQ